MPELPEVETIRADLAPLLVGRRIARVHVDFPDPHYQHLDAAAGRTVVALRRRGKYLIGDLGDREWIIHLGMTGQIGVGPSVPPGLRHVHVRVELEGGGTCYFNDARRFGRLDVVALGDYRAHPTLAAMGPEPLEPEFALVPFAAALARCRSVKPLLLGQRLVAGVGNIYADEALFEARLHPEQGRLTRPEATRLHAALRKVLRHGVEHRGTTFRDYRDGMGRYGSNQDFLQVFGRQGVPCPRCGTALVKTWVGQRGTHMCPRCQVLKAR